MCRLHSVITAMCVTAFVCAGVGATSAQAAPPAGSRAASVCIRANALAVPGGHDGTELWVQMLTIELARAGLRPERLIWDPTACGSVLDTTLKWTRKKSLWTRGREMAERMPIGLPIPGAGIRSAAANGIYTAQQVASLVTAFTDLTKPNDVFELTFALTRGNTELVATTTMPAVKAAEGHLNEVWGKLTSSLVTQITPHLTASKTGSNKSTKSAAKRK